MAIPATYTQISHHVTSLSTSRQQKLSSHCLSQVWNKLLTICNNLVNIIRLVTRLFQQVRYSHHIAVLLQPCVDNLVTFLFIMTVSDFIEQPCNKSDNAIKLVTSCQQLVPNLLQQLGTSSAKTTCWQLVNRFVTTCLQTCNNLRVFTCVAGPADMNSP
jgi:hypothetical protein